jgi:hypothetical protein
VHVAVGAHAWPQLPQFAVSVFVSVGTPLQTVLPASGALTTSVVASPCGEASSSVVGAPIAQPTTMHPAANQIPPRIFMRRD